MRQPWRDDELGDHVRRDVGLARAGRPLHREVGVVEPAQRGDDRPHVVVLAREGCEPVDAVARARRDAAQHVDRGIPRPRERVEARQLLRPLEDRLALAARGRRGAGHDGHRQLRPGEPGDRPLLDDEAVVEDLEHPHGVLGARAGPQALPRERRGGVVEHEQLGADAEPRPGRDAPAQQQLATVDAMLVFAVPALRHRGSGGVDHEHVAVVLPRLEGLLDAEEVRPPEALRLAVVVVDRRRREGERGVVGVAVGVVGRPGEPLQLDRERGGLVDLAGRLRGLDEQRLGHGLDTGLAGEPEQPVAQPQRRHAVVAVVVGEVVEHVLRGRRADEPGGRVELPGGEQFAGAHVLEDRVAARLHLGLAQLGAHVERLELLDRVRPAAHPHRPLHDRVEVDEHAVGEQLVDGRLPHAVPRGDREEVRALVARVVVDVHVRVRRPTRGDEREELLERHPLLREAVRPERREPLGRVDHAEQVVEAPVGCRALGVERIALEVEEQVAGVGLGDRGEGRGVAHDHGRGQRRVVGGAEPRLHPRRPRRPRPRAAAGPGCAGSRSWRRGCRRRGRRMPRARRSCRCPPRRGPRAGWCAGRRRAARRGAPAPRGRTWGSARRARSAGRPRRPGRRRRPARRRSARAARGAAGRRERCRRGGARWSTRRRAAARPCRRTARRRAGAARRRPRAGGAP